MSNINILALDTALTTCSVALWWNNSLKELSSTNQADRSKKLLSIINEILIDINIKDLSLLAFSAGPGSLTGLKIASSVIQALNFVYNKPIIKVSTLQALALQAYEELGIEVIMPCIDAKMGQVYYGLYKICKDNSFMIPVPIQEDRICPIKDLNLLEQSACLVGDGCELVSEMLTVPWNKQLNFRGNVSTNTSAKYIVKIANYIYINYDGVTNDAIPLYLHLYK